MTNHESPTVQPPPSRHSNPFATCWTKPGSLEFRFPVGINVEQLVAQFATQNWRGEIVGRHGSGKSTLLATIEPLLVAAGRQVTAVTLRDRQRWLPREFLRRALSLPQPIVIVDGYEQLTWLARIWLRWRCHRSRAGLLVTSHSATGLPPLIRLKPDLELIRQVVADLTHCRESSVTAADIVASHSCHGGNVRELLFDLYLRHELDGRHEAANRAERTVAAAVA